MGMKDQFQDKAEQLRQQQAKRKAGQGGKSGQPPEESRGRSPEERRSREERERQRQGGERRRPETETEREQREAEERLAQDYDI